MISFLERFLIKRMGRPIVQGSIDLDHDIFFFLILILVFVSRMLVRALWHFHEQTNPIPQRIVHGTTIANLWNTIFTMLMAALVFLVSRSIGAWEAECQPPAGDEPGTESEASGASSSEASLNQEQAGHRGEAGPSNRNLLSSANPLPSLPENPLISLLHEEGERGALLKELHTLVSAQLKDYCEIGVQRQRLSNSTGPYDQAALFILSQDLEISRDTNISELREWLDRIRGEPKLLAGLYDFYK